MRLKTLHPFLMRAAVMLVLAVMTATAWATTYTVTLKAGGGTGSDVTLNSENDYYVTSQVGFDVPKGKFYTMNDQLHFRVPDCPFSAPSESGKVFAGWSTNGGEEGDLYPGNHLPISGNVTLTACWNNTGDTKLLSITPSAGTLNRNFSPNENDYYLDFISGSPVEATVTAVPRDPNASITYNGSNSCPTLHNNDQVRISVTNGVDYEEYYVTVRTVYSITMTTEGEGTAKVYKKYNSSVETYVGEAGNSFKLKATPAEGWRFKEWQLVSGGGLLENPTQQNSGYYTFPDKNNNPDNVVLKAVFAQKISTWTALKTAMEAATTENPVSIELEGDITRSASEYITVTGKVTLDLHGKEIYGGGNMYSFSPIFSFDEGGDLTITDLTSDKKGQIYGVLGTDVIYVKGTGKVTLAAGTIGESSSGVYICGNGSFTMTGGTIKTKDNTAVTLYNSGSFTMSGGTITGNDNGVILNESGNFTMTGGTITGNKNGVDIVSKSATITVSGNVNIAGNTSRDVRLIWESSLNDVGGFYPIQIGGKLSPSARIGVWTDEDADKANGKVFTCGLKLDEEAPNGSVSNFFVNKRDENLGALGIVPKGISGQPPTELCFAKGAALTVNDAGGSENYWCSYYNSEKNMRVNSQGVTVYKAKLNGTNSVTLTEVFSGDGVIGKGKAVLIHSMNSDVLNLTETTDDASGDYDDNELKGTDSNADQDASWYYYVISKPDASSDFGFYKLQDGVQLGAHKAYLQVDPSIFSAGSRGFLSIGNETTSLTPIPSPTGEGSGAWYSLDGRRLTGKPARKGIYVRDGKKVVIK